jgi:hypothetical protein
MRRHLALDGATRTGPRSTRSLVSVAVVAILAVAFWAGALWIADVLIHIRGSGF